MAHNNIERVSPGDIVSGIESSELVEIKRIAPFGNKILIEGIGIQSRREIKRPLTNEEISRLVKIRGKSYSFDGDAELFLLGAEAERIRIAHQFDPLFAVNSSIVDPLPHQVEAVYKSLLPLPRIRFLLADDTGAGKTIMTGLLLKELLFRGVIKKILIITPGGLTKQWKEEELQEKFGLYGKLVNRATFEAEPGQFTRYDEGLFVTLIDFIARNESCLRSAEQTTWDFVVVDEAHKLSAYEYGSKLEESERYKAIKTLAKKTDHLLFLTATPHRGRKDTFRRLLLLLDEDLTEEERERIDKRIFRQVLTADPEKVEEERDEVERLFRLADSLKHHKEAKFAELLGVLDSSDVIRAEKEKLVIFTEHRDTLNSLAKRLEDKGYTVTTIHGQMDVDARKHAQREFLTRAKIMVATDAAGEGINLQFCRYLINWDIPWNPNRLEQRMGRIHRYGQPHDVWVYNLVAQNTREGAVLQKVLSKMDVMREQMGSDRVYDVIDDWLEDVPLVTLMEKAIDSEDEIDATTATETALDRASKEKAELLVALQKKTSLASRLDLRAARDLRDASDERRLQPIFIQRFFERAWTACGGTIRKDDQFPVSHIGPTPLTLLDLSRERRMPLPDRYDIPFVFDKQLVSVASKVRVPDRTKLMGPGHILFDTLIEWAMREARQAFARGSLLVDPNIATPQRVWLIRSTIEDGRIETRTRLAHERLSVVAADHMGLRMTSPSYLLNCIPPVEKQSMPDIQDRYTEDVQAWAYEEITEKQLKRTTAARAEECELRREYLNTAFTDLIVELQGELSDLQQAQLYGDDDAEERERLQKRIEELKTRKTERLKELDLMLNLRANLPDVITQAIIVPAPVAKLETEETSRGVPMRRDDEVEAIAMNVAMRYERSRGWTPVDVHADGEHYDVRSESPSGEKRYIEVKGRSESGAIILTGPELDKLRQLESRAWLYVVTFCKSEQPRLRIINDPASKLNPEMLYRQVQFVINEKDWLGKGSEVEICS